MDEIQALLGEVREAYSWVGLDAALRVRDQAGQGDRRPGALGARRAAHPEAFAAADISYDLKPKDGTFYAPKIDIYIDDALGREWQMATIQVDLVMLPERFDLTYIDENGQPQRPIAIHRAIYGSLERFIGILVEHFAGAFPLWLAPVQAVVIPIADRHVEAAEELAGVLRARGLARRGRRLGQPDAEQDPRSPRSRRCRTCWSSATARSRRGPWRRGPATPRAGSSRRPCLGRPRRSAGGGGRARDRSTLGPPERPLDCRLGTACAILPLRPEPGSWCTRAGRMDTLSRRGIDHQSRPARQPDDPHPTGAGRR